MGKQLKDYSKSKAEFCYLNIIYLTLRRYFIITNNYEILDKRDIIQCEQDVNKVIIDSNLDASMKQELQGTNSLAAKTTIFWKTVKKEYE